ncbi:low molecular weight protein-tyrosine-phosphatase [Paenibacillus harenae]|uniref:low molecular weight protein-tyrosine-phosphatase n=1 Tax=Paenibacillus harenae TaxID=306543 RepID=UPI002790CFC1|nr:low molecular weight protein-tyrosine-phosphatase [Paenibacillus harenae]MDQ0058005.1 protein-tyrosine phosphatase [Paenibacillus harenae]
MKAQVLFVCLGNICRSPMAEAVMRHHVKEAGFDSVIDVDSAGTGDWHVGHPPHEGTRKQLDDHHISYEGMRARLVNDNDFEQFDYIVCMDNNNIRDVRDLLERSGMRGDARKQIFTFMELLPELGIADVPDPYYSGNFDYVYELVEAGCRQLLLKIKSDLSL